MAKQMDRFCFRRVRMNEITIRRENGRENLFPIIVAIVLAVVAAFVIWWEAIEVVRLLEEGCSKIIDSMGRSSYPSKVMCPS
jgi:hypothetical protein